jgi:hypothetical protein
MDIGNLPCPSSCMTPQSGRTRKSTVCIELRKPHLVNSLWTLLLITQHVF